MILEQQYRIEIPKPVIPRELPDNILRELACRYPGYEIIFHGEDNTWVLYHVKHKAACPSEDILYKQCILLGDPGWHWFEYLNFMDKADEDFKKFMYKARNSREAREKYFASKKNQLTRDMKRDFDTYQIRRRKTIGCIPA